MEPMQQTQHVLKKLRLQTMDSTIIDVVAPLFETTYYQDEHSPNRFSEQSGFTQLFWETGTRQNNNFERVGLTLSKEALSLTIALDHYHAAREREISLVAAPLPERSVRSTLVIDSLGSKLIETYRSSGALVVTEIRDGIPITALYGEEAVDRFTPALRHSLAFIGLYGYAQNEQRLAA